MNVSDRCNCMSRICLKTLYNYAFISVKRKLRKLHAEIATLTLWMMRKIPRSYNHNRFALLNFWKFLNYTIVVRRNLILLRKDRIKWTSFPSKPISLETISAKTIYWLVHWVLNIYGIGVVGASLFASKGLILML